MNDADRQLLERIDRELRDALSATPSPDFLPRVRHRIAKQPHGSVVPMMRWLLLAGAAAAVLMFSVRTADRGSVPSPAEPPRGAAGFSRPDTTPPALPNPDAVRPQRDVRLKADATVRVARKINREPEVLVPEKDRIAFERFVAALSKGRIDETAVDAALSRRLEDIAIAPIEIKPLTSADQP